MGASENTKRRSKVRWVVIVFALLALVTGAVVLSLLPPKIDPDRQKVREILDASSSNRSAGFRALLEMGPRAYPGMREWIEFKQTGWRERLRTNWWKKFPRVVKNHMEDPLITRNRHIIAVMITAESGAVLARPLMSSLCKVGADPDWIARGSAVSALFWSVPESAEAKKRLAEWLAEPGQLGIAYGPSPDGNTEMWARLPEMAPLQIPLLRCVVSVNQAAAALGAMGTNAAVAIPALIEVCDNGFASPQVAAQPGQFVGKGGLWTNGVATHNRAPGYLALGKIGIATPEVMAAIKRGLGETNLEIQMAALTALQALHQPLGTNLMAIVTGYPAETGGVFPGVVRWAGTLGEGGRELLPWLKKFTSLEYDMALPGGIEASNRMAAAQRAGMIAVVQPDPRPAEMLRTNAIISVCQIAPEEIPGFLPELIPMIVARNEVAELLQSAKGQAEAIVPALEAELRGTNATRAATAAYILTGLRPGHAESIKLLRDRLAQGSLNDRMAAGLLLWKRTGECKELLAMCVEGLNTKYVAPTPGGPPAGRAAYYSAVLTLQELGPAARPIFPQLRQAITNGNQVVRSGAARMLLKYAPEMLPKIE